jgi:hypothetical protein
LDELTRSLEKFSTSININCYDTLYSYCLVATIYTRHSRYEVHTSAHLSEPSAIEKLHDTAENNTSFEPITYSFIANAPSVGPMGTLTPRPSAVDESDMELYTINPPLDETDATEPEFSLPPVDGGKDAWLFLFSAFVLEILVWGNTSVSPAPKQTNAHSTDTSQAFLSLSVYFKNTTPRTHHLPAPGIYP